MTKELKDLIKTLKDSECKKVLVLGAHRSGTRIATHIISKETKLKRVLEDNFVNLISQDNTLTTEKLYDRFFAQQEEYVLQCPFLTNEAHLIEADAIIYLTRNHKEIKSSAKRVGWIETQNEKQYQSTIKEMDRLGLKTEFNDISLNKYSWVLKQHFWNKYQSTNLKKGTISLTLDYNDLKGHKDFIEKETRDKTNKNKGFFPNQITPEIEEDKKGFTDIKEVREIQNALSSEANSPYIKQELPEGESYTKRTLTLNLCLCAIWAYKYYKYNEKAEFGQYYRKQDFFHQLLQSTDTKNIVNNYTRLKYWDLLVPMPTSPTEVIYKKGWWGITETTIKFIQREIGLPKYALTYNDLAYEHITNPFVMIEDILKEYELDYTELLKP